jgi:hypothetical protein
MTAASGPAELPDVIESVEVINIGRKWFKLK